MLASPRFLRTSPSPHAPSEALEGATKSDMDDDDVVSPSDGRVAAPATNRAADLRLVRAWRARAIAFGSDDELEGEGEEDSTTRRARFERIAKWRTSGPRAKTVWTERTDGLWGPPGNGGSNHGTRREAVEEIQTDQNRGNERMLCVNIDGHGCKSTGIVA